MCNNITTYKNNRKQLSIQIIRVSVFRGRKLMAIQSGVLEYTESKSKYVWACCNQNNSEIDRNKEKENFLFLGKIVLGGSSSCTRDSSRKIVVIKKGTHLLITKISNCGFPSRKCNEIAIANSIASWSAKSSGPFQLLFCWTFSF